MSDLRKKKAFFPCVLDHKPGLFLDWLLYRLFRNIRFDEGSAETLKSMNRKGTIVYAVKYSSQLDYLLYHYRFLRARLPSPKIAFNINMALHLPLQRLVKIIHFHLSHYLRYRKMPGPFQTGFYREAIIEGITALIPILNSMAFSRHFIHSEKDPLNFLIETQREMEKPIYFVPLLVLYKKTPEKENPSLLDIFFGFKDNPGFLRKIGLFIRHHRGAFIDFGTPLNLKGFLENQPQDRSTEDLAGEVGQTIIDRIDAQKRVILGPIMKSRQQIKEKVLKDPRIDKTIERLSKGDPKKKRQLRKKAEEHFEETAADYNTAYIQFFQKSLSWLWKKLFEKIEVEPGELAHVRDWTRKGPVIYIPSHKSHIDYLILNYVLYIHNMHTPRIAAGANLAFWPMGHIFRKCGAFFIRRTFKGIRLYAEIFERYIKELLAEGYPLEFFIEGGRSRNGKLILPKTGFLSILFKAKNEGYCEDLVFVPASISYDRVPEEKSLLKELTGRSKEKESFKQILKARRFLKGKYGRVYIRFSEPVSLNDYMAARNLSNDNIQTALAFDLTRALNKVTLVTPLAIVASAILTGHRRGFYNSEIKETAQTLFRLIEEQRAPKAPTLDSFDEPLNKTIRHLEARKVVKVLEDVDGGQPYYVVEDDRKPELEYYKNNTIHFFLPYSFVAVAILRGIRKTSSRQDIAEDYAFLRELFKKDFVYNETGNLDQEIQRVLSYFLNAAFIEEDDEKEGYKVTRIGFDKLPTLAAFTKTFLESYWVASNSFFHKEDKRRKRADLLKDMHHRGMKLYKAGLIDHVESISQVNFQNASEYINDNILARRKNSEKDLEEETQRLSELTQKLYEFCRYRA